MSVCVCMNGWVSVSVCECNHMWVRVCVHICVCGCGFFPCAPLVDAHRCQSKIFLFCSIHVPEYFASLPVSKFSLNADSFSILTFPPVLPGLWSECSLVDSMYTQSSSLLSSGLVNQNQNLVFVLTPTPGAPWLNSCT